MWDLGGKLVFVQHSEWISMGKMEEIEADKKIEVCWKPDQPGANFIFSGTKEVFPAENLCRKIK